MGGKHRSTERRVFFVIKSLGRRVPFYLDVLASSDLEACRLAREAVRNESGRHAFAATTKEKPETARRARDWSQRYV